MAGQQTQQDDRIAQVLERLVEQAPVPEIGYGHPKYQERLKAEGVFDTFPVPVFQNGREAQARGLKPETVEHVVALKPGVYLGGKVEVAKDPKGRVHLLYKQATVEDRMRFQSIAPDFDTLVAKLWAEQPATAH